MQEIIGVDMVLHCGVTEESWLARFRTIWPLHKPHVIFANASVDHQRLIEIIDPEYVAQERQKMKKAKEIASQL
jgi:hypothetical protein